MKSIQLLPTEHLLTTRTNERGVLVVGEGDDRQEIQFHAPNLKLDFYVNRSSEDLSILNLAWSKGDRYAQEELDAQNEAANAHPAGAKFYWKSRMVGIYKNHDGSLMTEEDFESEWDEGDADNCQDDVCLDCRGQEIEALAFEIHSIQVHATNLQQALSEGSSLSEHESFYMVRQSIEKMAELSDSIINKFMSFKEGFPQQAEELWGSFQPAREIQFNLYSKAKVLLSILKRDYEQQAEKLEAELSESLFALRSVADGVD